MKKEEFIEKVLKIKKENKDDYKKIIDKSNIDEVISKMIDNFMIVNILN